MTADLRHAGAETGAARGRRAIPVPLIGGMLLAVVVVVLLAPFASVDPPARLSNSNAPWTDEGFNLANARNLALFGRFGMDDVDRSLSNGAYSGLAALVFSVTGPSIPAGRWISIAATAAAVLLFAVGLARPLGTRAALLAAATLGGCQLLLQYGRLAFVEPLLVALLAGALVLVARAPERPSLPAGAVAGLLVAAAISVKVIAVVPGAILLGVPLALGLWRRDRAAVRMLLAAIAAVVLAAVGWALLVALPNLDRLRVALRIWPAVVYPVTPAALARRLGVYAADSDGALPRAAPLLAAAAAGLAACAATWRSLPRTRRDLLAIGALWGVGAWAAIAVGDYAPNRYIIPALPGLAVVAGSGLAALADRLAALASARRAAPGDRAAGLPRLVAVVLAAAVAAPGIASHVRSASAAGDQLSAGQRQLAAAVPDGAVVFGSYGPTMLFETGSRLVTPWAPAGANVDDPVGRFGVTHVLSDGSDLAVTPDLVHDAEPVARVAWGPYALVLYRLRQGDLRPRPAPRQNSPPARPAR
jgi:Dolichyl-phosphate-mannose-protein mannosyltransferase